jgi:type II secretory ATPase GspE/PulE/Tfp pilus assembly ATPase PilB-like protein
MSNTSTVVRRSQLGELLVAQGKLTREELSAALAYREERGLKLGQALVALHLVTQQDLARALRSQGRIHCLHLTPGIVDPAVARLLPEAMARQYVAVPVHRVAGRVTVAMEDPAEEYDVDAIAIAIGEPVFAVHADPGRIQETITSIWPPAEPRADEGPRLTLLRGPLPAEDVEEAAEALVRAALREARAIGASSFHVESTPRGTELTFRVDGRRTPGAVLAPEWAGTAVRALADLASHGGPLELDGAELALDVALLDTASGPCARARIATRPAPIRVEDLPLEPEEQTAIVRWLHERGLLLVAGARGSVADGLAEDLALRAAKAGRRVYRLGASAVDGSDCVLVARGVAGDASADVAAITEQAPDVLDAGLLADPRAFAAAVAAARRGVLVIVRVEDRDAAAAAARVVAAAPEPHAAAGALVGAIALVDVRLACTACATNDARATECPRCCGTGADALRRVAEAIDLHGALREPLARNEGAERVRSVARDLGYQTIAARTADLVEKGLVTSAEVERASRRAEGWSA